MPSTLVEERLTDSPKLPSTKRRPRVLVFSRSYLIRDFQNNVAGLSDRWEFLFLTDGKKNGVNDTRELFYRNFRLGAECDELSPDQVDDCIARCRLLRNLPRADATRRLHAMASALSEWFDRYRPDLILCQMVDEYVTHLVSILSSSRGVPFVCYAYSFFPGYVQVAGHWDGRPVLFREPHSDEINDAVARISQAGFRQQYGQPPEYSLRRHLWSIGRHYLKRCIFRIKGVLEQDPLNVHYAVTPFVADRTKVWNYPRQSNFQANWRDELAASARTAIYVPLAFFPESTIDYWVSDRAALNYEDKTIEMLTELSKKFVIVVKEHPHMAGVRPVDFYRRIRSLQNVILAPTETYSTEILDRCAAILLGGGSGGVEAVLRDKPIFTYCNNSYWFSASKATFLDLGDLDRWPSVILEAMNSARSFTNEQKRDFIRHCLKTTMVCRPGGKRWPLTEQDQLSLLLQAALEAPAGCSHTR